MNKLHFKFYSDVMYCMVLLLLNYIFHQRIHIYKLIDVKHREDIYVYIYLKSNGNPASADCIDVGGVHRKFRSAARFGWFLILVKTKSPPATTMTKTNVYWTEVG